MVNKVYTYWDQDHVKRIANLCAGQKAARTFRLHVKDDYISSYEIYFARHLSNLYIEQESFSEACEVWDFAVEPFAKEGGDSTVYWTAMTSKAEVMLHVGDTAEAVRIGENTVLNVRRLLEAETAAHPLTSSESQARLEATLGLIQSLLGSAYARLQSWEISQEYHLSALITCEKLYGPTNLATLKRAAAYMGMVYEPVTRQSVEQRENWRNTVHDLLQAANPNRTPKSCKYDRWSLICSAVRTSVRHRPGTELYNRLSKKQPIHFLSS